MYYSKPFTRQNMEDRVQNIKNEIKDMVIEELRAEEKADTTYNRYSAIVENPYNNSNDDIYIENLIKNLLRESDMVLDTKAITGGANAGHYRGWVNKSDESKGKEIFYGIGTAAVLGVLFPGFRKKVQTVVVRTASEGMDLYERARMIVARAKEDIEDLVAEASFRELTRR